MIALIAAISLRAGDGDGIFTNSIGERFKVAHHPDYDSNRGAYEIECNSIINGKGTIWLNSKDFSKFTEALYKLQSRYKELLQAAKAFKVSNVVEKIKVKFPKTEFHLGDMPYGTGRLEAEFGTLGNGKDYVMCSAVYTKNIGLKDKRLQSNLFDLTFGSPQDIDKFIHALLNCPDSHIGRPK